VLRPATQDALTRLRLAASLSDRELDRALSDVGVLPPLDLSEIRNVLKRPGCELATCPNCDGHTIVEVSWNTALSALIHHDGRVQPLNTAAA
jgi:hypothetical protein